MPPSHFHIFASSPASNEYLQVSQVWKLWFQQIRQDYLVLKMNCFPLTPSAMGPKVAGYLTREYIPSLRYPGAGNMNYKRL